MSGEPLFVGIDLGTQGVRVVAADARGRIAAEARRGLAVARSVELPTGHFEQAPEGWWQATRDALRELAGKLQSAGRAAADVAALAVDSTSGTVVLLDEQNRPVRPALMYNDRRAQEEADELCDHYADFQEKVGYRFNSSFALPKLIWLKRNEPATWARTTRIVHAADYLVGKLTGVWDASDQSNALKTGFDLVDFSWPGFLQTDLGIPATMLPRVVMSGTPIASISGECASETGLAASTIVTAGMTDASADLFASGAHGVGDWNSILGTTLVLKGITRNLIKDRLGRLYCHLHPLGLWMPGGASNVGAQSLDARFRDADKPRLDMAALNLSPTSLTIYPLMRKGERFPFNRPDAEGFIEGEVEGTEQLYAGMLEGIAMTERLAYEVVAGLGAEVGQRVYTTGGGAASDEWMQIRSDVLGRELARAAHPSAAMGTAIIAASKTFFPDAGEATLRMVSIDKIVQPRSEMRAPYEEAYGRFRRALAERGYI